jgi:hypothetical protein
MKYVTILIACGLLALGAVLHGATTHRWASLSTSDATMDALHAHTVTLGDYEAESIPNELPLKEKSIGSCKRYFSPSRNSTIVVSVITGPAGSVSTHTPDVCYVASGYKMLRTPVREAMDVPGVGPISFYVSEFEKKTASTTDRHRVRWSWSADGQWAAPDQPRFAYLRVANLAKIYIVTNIAEAESTKSLDDSQSVRQFTSSTFAQYQSLFIRQ